jgi:TolA-binding protein
MLKKEEKAYCRALEALQNKDYTAADKEFESCSDLYADSQGFNIISEATKLLAELKREKKKFDKTENEIEEAVCHGEETVVCGQGQQEETP